MAGPKRGPMAKRADERERRNKPDGGDITTLGPEELKRLPFDVETMVEPPEAPRHWEEGAKQVYEATLRDPARIWMGPADWAVHWLICEDIHRNLAPQYVALSEGGLDVDTGEKISDSVVRERLPLKGASLTAYTKWFGMIGIGEASRLAMRREITFHEKPAELATVSELDIVDDREGLFQDGGQ